jgi:NAD(P)-dependent dehydrogenase (short-subunit alcohol dehydrogenase family)
MSAFVNKVALVTGAASGIGAAVTARLATAGAEVYHADLLLGPTNGTPIAQSNGHGIALDVRDESAWEAAIGEILQRSRHLDILVNCVGVSAGSPLTDTSLTEWRHVLGTNLDGAFLATKYGMRAMRTAGGVIVHIGSASGIRPAAGAAAYSTSKAGLRMLVATAAKECRAAGYAIRVNLVSPAGVKTPMWRSMAFFQDLVAKLGSEDAAYDAMSQGGGGTFIDPDDVARVVCFLASDQAAHVTGVDIPVDNGYVL